ncbi:hypothetical protein [Pseudolabrys taiwanensis]|uniref:hypothetical protein n=1 Tax=Pseudolabrys taiwanensis TaxID=331696 RepID=UPI0013B3D945|nr:hypothetical protein [Pseudolabrys taiwanensis]
MSDQLFQHSLHGWWQNVLRAAADDVNNLDRKFFSDPALAGELQRIVEKYSLDVARIDREAISADAREEEFQGSDYGHRYTGKRSLLDVEIPFSGDLDSFRLSPSRAAVIMQRISIGRDSLKFTIPDDQNAQREVDTVMTQLNQNLDKIRAEYEQAKPQLGQTIQQMADSRKAQIAKEAERDKRLSFKVNR